jgi:hypothetical protein
MKEDIRWKQRFSNYKKAFEQLIDLINPVNRVGKTFYQESKKT